MHQPYNTYLALMKPIIHLNWNTIVFCCYLELFLHNCHFQSMIWRFSLTWYDRSNINPVKDFTFNFHLENSWLRFMMIWLPMHTLIFSKVNFIMTLFILQITINWSPFVFISLCMTSTKQKRDTDVLLWYNFNFD